MAHCRHNSKTTVCICYATQFDYHTRAIISRGLYTFYPISKEQLCTVTFGLMYGLYSRAASNQERPMEARVRYTTLFCFLLMICLEMTFQVCINEKSFLTEIILIRLEIEMDFIHVVV